MSAFIKKCFYAITFLCFVFLLLFLFRADVLQLSGKFLIHEDTLQKSDAVFVLGGDSYDRGNAAAVLYFQGYSNKIICLGENVPNFFKALNIFYAESEATKINLEKKNVPDSAIVLLKKGTSTKEEISYIIEYCVQKNFKKIIILTSKFHTRRVNMIFRKEFEKNNIELMISGAPSSVYSEEEWWKTEEGLIMVNNEFVKLFYYLLKY